MFDESFTEDKNVIAEYIKKNTHKESILINEDSLLFREGFFDSMGFVLLIDFIEEKFNIKTSDEDLIEENFESINAIAKYISKKSLNKL
jgi:acyl carrier protein